MTSRPLWTPPAAFARTREAAHRLAVYVVSPARRRVTGRIGLRAGLGGFTTPPFGDDERVALDLERRVLVAGRAGGHATAPVSTLNAAAAFALGGAPDADWAGGLDVPPLGDPDEPLALDPAAAALLGAWYAVAFEVLGALREKLAGDDPGEVQLWPEHFDAALDAAAAPGRVTFGASPGDAAVPEPYLYVLPPGPVARDGLWNAEAFTGAVLPLSRFVDAADQRDAALAFLRRRRAAVAA